MPLSNGPSIPTSGLVFLMDPSNLRTYPGSGTTATDLVPTVAGGTMTNVVASSNYLTFNKANTSVTTYSTLSANTSKVTMVNSSFSISYYANTTFNASFHPWVDKFGASGYRTTITGAGRIGIEQRTQLSVYESATTSGSVLSNMVWSHVTVTYNASSRSCVFYVNGSNVFQQGSWTVVQGDSGMGFQLGYSPNNGVYADGQLGPVAIYNRDLNPVEVNQIYAAYCGRYNI